MSTYTPIATINITGTTSSVTFSGIPQTYTDLVLVTAGPSSNVQDLNCTFNGDTGSNYGFVYLYGDGTTPASGNTANATRIVVGRTGSDNTGIAQFYNYSNSNIRKTILSRTNRPGEITMGFCNVWRNTAAITSMTITPASGTLSAGYTLNLYGIANAGITNVAKATGGDIVTTDGTYWYHGFLTSGVFAPTQALNADVLVVAGGGGGGNSGGGAGGIFYATSQALTNTNYAVTVGAGGSPFAGGNNSVFGSLTSAIAGGVGGAPTGGAGGSGGGTNGGAGAGGASTQSSTGGTGYGNAGGSSGSAGGGSGGGGAGAAGQGYPGGSVGGAGGAGINTFSSWATATYTGVSGFYAGGGGGVGSTGGAGGSGGGGAGGAGSATAVSGTANTGGGGGGSSGTAGSGGSGIVIVRYAV